MHPAPPLCRIAKNRRRPVFTTTAIRCFAVEKSCTQYTVSVGSRHLKHLPLSLQPANIYTHASDSSSRFRACIFKPTVLLSKPSFSPCSMVRLMPSPGVKFPDQVRWSSWQPQNTKVWSLIFRYRNPSLSAYRRV
jgi:hypothetical protein